MSIMSTEKFINCVVALQNKDMKALRMIYEAYYKLLRDTARGYVRNKEDAEDIAMTVIEKLCDYRGEPKKIVNHVGLLVRMTQNEAINFLHRSERAVCTESEVLATRACEQEDNLFYYDVLDLLDDAEKDIFIKHIVWDLTLKRIARDRGEAYITVKRKYKKIKDKIATLYKN